MSVPVVSFFNNKGGVGKTSLVYHLSWMLDDLGVRVLTADLDPQANLTASFVDESRIEKLWSEESAERRTVHGAIVPLVQGIGDVSDSPHVETISDQLHLLPGDLELASFEDDLSQQWPLAMDGKERAFRVLSAFWRTFQNAAEDCDAEVILVDLGPNLGAINRAALISSDFLVIPLAPDLFSLQGLRNLGPTLEKWRRGWLDRRERNPQPKLSLPTGRMESLGYVVLQHAVRLDRPVHAYQTWIERIPATYSRSICGTEICRSPESANMSVEDDPNCIALLNHYRSLVPLAQEARKPIFHLQYADGAIGAHGTAARAARQDFEDLAKEIRRRWKARLRENPLPAEETD